MTEKTVQCPYCWEDFTILIDTSETEQTYVEDCYVCCRPIQFTVICADDEIISVNADRAQ